MPMKATKPAGPEGRGYETRDVNVRFLAAVVVGLFLLALGGMGVSWWFERNAAERQQATERPRSPLAETLSPLPPEPRLQVTPGVNLAVVRAQEEAMLSRYEWIDPKNGIVRIPIDRAIEVLAERGLPARGEPSRPATAQRQRGKE